MVGLFTHHVDGCPSAATRSKGVGLSKNPSSSSSGGEVNTSVELELLVVLLLREPGTLTPLPDLDQPELVATLSVDMLRLTMDIPCHRLLVSRLLLLVVVPERLFLATSTKAVPVFRRAQAAVAVLAPASTPSSTAPAPTMPAGEPATPSIRWFLPPSLCLSLLWQIFPSPRRFGQHNKRRKRQA